MFGIQFKVRKDYPVAKRPLRFTCSSADKDWFRLFVLILGGVSPMGADGIHVCLVRSGGSLGHAGGYWIGASVLLLGSCLPGQGWTSFDPYASIVIHGATYSGSCRRKVHWKWHY